MLFVLDDAVRANDMDCVFAVKITASDKGKVSDPADFVDFFVVERLAPDGGFALASAGCEGGEV